MNSTRHLVESATGLLQSYIETNIASYLAAEQTLQNATKDYGVPLPPFREYFIAKNFLALQPPSLFIVCTTVNYRKERDANFIFATAKYGFAAIAEGQTTNISTRACWRYQAALSSMLDNLDLTAADNAFKIKVIVQGAEFSEDYSLSTQQGDVAQKWRKGFLLNCDVNFYEAY